MTERKLASIQKISAITDIPGADNIQVATILGWQVVINKKDKFKVGDLVIYIETDSIVPHTNPTFDFLKDRKYRVRIIKLKKTNSEGICFPLNILETCGKLIYENNIPKELILS